MNLQTFSIKLFRILCLKVKFALKSIWEVNISINIGDFKALYYLNMKTVLLISFFFFVHIQSFQKYCFHSLLI